MYNILCSFFNVLQMSALTEPRDDVRDTWARYLSSITYRVPDEHFASWQSDTFNLSLRYTTGRMPPAASLGAPPPVSVAPPPVMSAPPLQTFPPPSSFHYPRQPVLPHTQTTQLPLLPQPQQTQPTYLSMLHDPYIMQQQQQAPAQTHSIITLGPPRCLSAPASVVDPNPTPLTSVWSTVPTSVTVTIPGPGTSTPTTTTSTQAADPAFDTYSPPNLGSSLHISQMSVGSLSQLAADLQQQASQEHSSDEESG